jgi:aspartate/methionine/tyrosine aminotransferase
LTRLNTNLISQYGALAALKDEDYIKKSEGIIRRNYSHIKETIGQIKGLSIPVEPKYGFSMVIDVSHTGTTAQELTVALFKRRVAVYPGDGMGNIGATEYIRLNISRPDLRAFKYLRNVLPPAIEEARSGIYRKGVIGFFKEKKTERAERIIQKMKEIHLADERN